MREKNRDMGWVNQRRQYKIHKIRKSLAPLPVFRTQTVTRWIPSVSLLVQAIHSLPPLETEDFGRPMVSPTTSRKLPQAKKHNTTLRAFVELVIVPGFFSCLAADDFGAFRSKTQGNLVQIDIYLDVLRQNNTWDKCRCVETFFRVFVEELMRTVSWRFCLFSTSLFPN